jgi:polysulfide reductase chain C
MSIANTAGGQKIWGRRMALSLFLAGTAAGAYLLGFVLSVASARTMLAEVSLPASAILAVLAVGMLAWHTERRANMLRAFARPGTSWMSRGAIGLALFLLLAVVDIVLWLAMDAYLSSAGHAVVGVLGSIVALFVLAYTGMLLRSMRPVAFWDSAWLPVLFVASGLTGGMMVLALGLGIGNLAAREVAQGVDILLIVSLCFLVLEAALVGGYLWRRNAGEPAASVKTIVAGALAIRFWIGAVALGFVVPIVVCAYSLRTSSGAGLIIIGVAGLAGKAMLKYLLVAGGRPRALDVAGEHVPPPIGTRMTVAQYVEAVKKAN